MVKIDHRSESPSPSVAINNYSGSSDASLHSLPSICIGLLSAYGTAVKLVYYMAILALMVPPPLLGTETPDARLNDLIKRVDAQATEEFSKDPQAGLTVGVVSYSGLCWTKSYGFANVEKKIPASDQTLYRIGSLTRQFTAVMLLQLVDNKSVLLSSPVSTYFPPIANLHPSFPITLRQLATHTAGLPPGPIKIVGQTKDPMTQWEGDLIYTLLFQFTKFVWEPDSHYQVSQMGYAMLGAALSHACGESYVDYVRKHILDPLKMEHSFFELDESHRAEAAHGYIIALSTGTITGVPETENLRQNVPNDGMYSTVADLARFIAFEMGAGPASVLSPKQLHRNRESIYMAAPNLQLGHCVGFTALKIGERLVYGDYGGLPERFEADVFFDPRARVGLIILRNATGGKFSSRTIVDTAFIEPSGLTPAAKQMADVPPALTVQEYLGNYRRDSGKVFAITAKGEKLYVREGINRPAPLDPIATDLYAITGMDNLYMAFVRNETHQVVGVDIESYGGQSITLGAKPFESSIHAEKVIDQAQLLHP